MINVFTIKENIVLILAPLLGAIMYMVGAMYYGLIGGILFCVVGALLSVITGKVLLKNPFSDMIKGKGILALDINSTGIIRPFIIGLKNPVIQGKLDDQFIEDIFDRQIVQQMSAPTKINNAGLMPFFNLFSKKKKVVNDKEQLEDTDNYKGGLVIKLTEQQYNKGRFAMMHYPVILWNSTINSAITKDFLSMKERGTLADHAVLYLNRVIKELSITVRDFARHVVDQLKPQVGMFQNPIVRFIMIAAIVLLVGFLIVKLIPTLGGSGVGSALSTAGSAVKSTAATSGTITPLS